MIFVTLLDHEGQWHQRIPLSDAAGHTFIDYSSVRRVASYRGQGHLPGYYWCCSSGEQVVYESRLEMFALMDIDFQGRAENILSQPVLFHFSWGRGGKDVKHTPDFLVQLRGGGKLLIDVKPADSAERLGNRQVFKWTAMACEQLGWDFEVRTEPDEIYLANLRWLAGYRRRPVVLEQFAEAVLDACSARPLKIGELVSLFGVPVLVRPVVFHLLWRRALNVNMLRPLSDQSSIWLPSEGEALCLVE